jgi:dihydroorotate dehydrogenase (fumarate)
MDLSTTFLGYDLNNPLILGASPLSDRVETLVELAAAGISGVVLRSLYVEQIGGGADSFAAYFEGSEAAFPGQASVYPELGDFVFGPDEYLSLIHKYKQTLDIPVFASINGSAEGDWYQYARMMEEAGADGLELNLYFLAADTAVTGPELEEQLLRIVTHTRHRLRIPLMVKLSPFYTSMGNFAARLDGAGADGLVLFNRFYQPDIDLEAGEVKPVLHLSDSSELPLRLRWAALLFGRVHCDIAITGGVHTGEDVLKSVLAGASAVQLVSGLLQGGPERVKSIVASLEESMSRLDFETLAEMRGSLSHLRSENPEAIERTNYMKTLRSWKPSS